MKTKIKKVSDLQSIRRNLKEASKGLEDLRALFKDKRLSKALTQLRRANKSASVVKDPLERNDFRVSSAEIRDVIVWQTEQLTEYLDQLLGATSELDRGVKAAQKSKKRAA